MNIKRGHTQWTFGLAEFPDGTWEVTVYSDGEARYLLEGRTAAQAMWAATEWAMERNGKTYCRHVIRESGEIVNVGDVFTWGRPSIELRYRNVTQTGAILIMETSDGRTMRLRPGAVGVTVSDVWV